MTLNELVCRAASAYADGYVLEYWDADRGDLKANPCGGDTLAEFVAQELASTFDPDAGDGEQIATAIRAMLSAADQLQTVADALNGLTMERLAA